MNLVTILLSVLLNCAAQLCIRKGMMQVGEIGVDNLMKFITPMISNVYIWLAMLCYSISILLWIMVLSKVEVSFAYPFLSIGYIIAAIVGFYYFGESLSLTRIIGIGVICIGVFLISRS